MLNRLLDGFEGKLTSSKWAQIEKCSQDTTLRDIDDLVNRKILVKDAGGGRSNQLFARAVIDDRPRYRGAIVRCGTGLLAGTVQRVSIPLLRAWSHTAARN
jgi:hypothetical protein